jgi:hypothetical protein
VSPEFGLRLQYVHDDDAPMYAISDWIHCSARPWNASLCPIPNSPMNTPAWPLLKMYPQVASQSGIRFCG